MLVKKFRSETFEEAVKNIKRELGPNAIILSKKTIKEPGKVLGLWSKPIIELTAAVDKRTNDNNQMLKTEMLSESQNISELTIKDGIDRVSVSKRAKDFEAKKRKSPRFLNKKYIEIDDNDNIEELTNTILNTSDSQVMNPGSKINPAFKTGVNTFFGNEISDVSEQDQIIGKTPKTLQKLCLDLTMAGVETKYINEVVTLITQKMNPLLIQKENYLESFAAKILMDNMKVSGDIKLYDKNPRVVILMGPPGVGKTTNIAKIASNFSNKGKKVGVVSLDVFKIGAIEQLKVYSNILKFPLRIVSKVCEFPKIISEMKDMDLVIVDTAGHGKKESESLGEMKSLLNINVPIEKHLCLSACMRDSDAFSSYKRFTPVGIDRLIFTKLDETSSYGSIYNLMRKTNLQVSYFSIGQRVPEDIEVATKERLVDLILKLSSN